jgi:hypothetical protein
METHRLLDNSINIFIVAQPRDVTLLEPVDLLIESILDMPVIGFCNFIEDISESRRCRA